MDILNNKTKGTGLPVCHTDTGYPELTKMIEVMLHGYFRTSEDEAPSLLIKEQDGFLVLSSHDNSKALKLERPFTKEQLVQTARTVVTITDTAVFSSDPENRLAIYGDLSVKLTDTEFRLYSAILEKGDRYITAEELSTEVWGTPNRNLCTVYISYLRNKLDKAFGDGTLITANKKGYHLRSPCSSGEMQ